MIDIPDPETYQGQPIERWKMVMVEHLAYLRQRCEELERLRKEVRNTGGVADFVRGVDEANALLA